MKKYPNVRMDLEVKAGELATEALEEITKELEELGEKQMKGENEMSVKSGDVVKIINEENFLGFFKQSQHLSFGDRPFDGNKNHSFRVLLTGMSFPINNNPSDKLNDTLIQSLINNKAFAFVRSEDLEVQTELNVCPICGNKLD